MVDGVHSEIPEGAHSDASAEARRAEAAKLEQAVALVHDRISKINADPSISAEDKRKLVDELQSALATGNVSMINASVQSVVASESTAAANTSYEMIGNASVSQSYELSASQLAQVNARSMYVDLNNAQQVHRYAAAWVDHDTPPAVREHETQAIETFITKNPEGRQAIAIMNAHPTETRRVNTEQAQDVVALQTLQRHYAGNRAASEAITSTLTNRLYSHGDMHGEITALTRDPSRIVHFEQVVNGHEATLRRDLIRRAGEHGAQQERLLTAVPAAHMTPEQNVDTYLAVSRDKQRAATAAQIAEDVYKHPAHVSQYNAQQLKDANSWWTNHPRALEQAITETANNVLAHANERGKEAIRNQAALAEDKSHSVAARGENVAAISTSGNAYLASLMNQSESKTAMNAASQHVLESGVLDTALHKASTAVEALGGGAASLLSGDAGKGDAYALRAGRGVKRTLDGVIGENAAQVVGRVATLGFTGGSHVAAAVAHPIDTASSIALNISSGVSGLYSWATGAKPATPTHAAPQTPSTQQHAAMVAAQDTNHDGKVSAAELAAARQQADANHDGKVSMAELNTYLSHHPAKPVTPQQQHAATPAHAAQPQAAHPANGQSAFATAEAKLGLDPKQAHTLAEIKKALHDHGVKDADIATMMADGKITQGELINAAAHVPNARPAAGKPAHAH